MSSVEAVTYDMVFKVRVASFYDLLPAGREALLKDFSDFIQSKGQEHNFLVWRTIMETGNEK
jgi:hypothetical protein